MSEINLRELSGKLSRLRIAVVGDVFLDKYTYGLVRGTSRETPVPVYEFESRILAPGAAGNVACNFAALGAKVYIIGVVGNDEDGRALTRELKQRKVQTRHLICLQSMRTNSYEKLLAHTPHGKPQETLLVQTGMPENSATKRARQRILPSLKRLSHSVDAVVVVDQVSHLCNQSIINAVASFCRKGRILSVGNSRRQVHLFQEFDLLVVNEIEAAQASDLPPRAQNFNLLGRTLLHQARQAVLMTTGADGMSLYEKKAPPVHNPSVVKEIIDVTGAGDTALAAYVCARLAKLPPRDALLLSNAAAAVAISKPGTATATLKEIAPLL